MRSIAIINQKGGVGKTTSALNLGYSMGRFGGRTLVVDLDPQNGMSIASNLTMLVPVTALGAVLLLLALREWRTEIWRVVDRYAGPALVTAFVFVMHISQSATKIPKALNSLALLDSTAVCSAVRIPAALFLSSLWNQT